MGERQKGPCSQGYLAGIRGQTGAVEYSPGATKKDGRILVLAAAIITCLCLARDPQAGYKTNE